MWLARRDGIVRRQLVGETASAAISQGCLVGGVGDSESGRGQWRACLPTLVVGVEGGGGQEEGERRGREW